MLLLKGVVDGTAAAVPTVTISHAVAVQIYNLIFGDRGQRAKELTGVAARGLYVILASLARGTRVEPPQSRDLVDGLRHLLGRPAAGGREPGLALRFRETCHQRRFDPELKGADIHEARRRLFIRWDNIPFEFDCSARQTYIGCHLLLLLTFR